MSPEEYISAARRITDAARGGPAASPASSFGAPPATNRLTALLLCADTGKARIVECDDPWAAADSMMDAVGGDVTVEGVSSAGIGSVIEGLGEYYLGGGWLSPGVPDGMLRGFRSPRAPGRTSRSRGP